LIVSAQAAESSLPDEFKRLLAIAVEIARRHEDESVFQDTRAFVAARPEHRDFLQRLDVGRDASATQRAVEREKARRELGDRTIER
jgi:hypothetical protein